MTAPRKAPAKRVAKAPQDRLEPTSPKGWKKPGQVLKLPSGNVIRLQNPGIMGLANKGLIPNSLMSIIMESVTKGTTELSAEELMTDGKLDVSDMFDMMDNAIIAMAVEPEIHHTPAEGEERDSDQLYIDEVEEQDKLFIWQWATGGTTDVEQFRRESGSMLGALSGLSGVEQKSK